MLFSPSLLRCSVLTTFALCITGAIACGSGDPPGSEGPARSPVDRGNDEGLISETVTHESLSAEEICPAFIHDACRAVFICPDLADITEYKDEEHCRQDIPCRGLSNFESELGSGYFTWDAEKAAACHDFLNDDLCAAADELVSQSLQGVLDLCPQSPAIPSQVEGGPCLSSLSCPSGTYCAAEGQCGGTCTPAQPEGATCQYDRDCADGLPCKMGRCGVPARVGEPCPGFVCEEDAWCRIPAGATEFVCVLEAIKALGDTCTSDSECAEGRNCLILSGDEPGICSDPVELDGACQWASDCADGLVCLDATCSHKPVLGAACRSYLFGGDDCAEGFICADALCKTARFWGETCGSSDEVCAEGICEEGLCVMRKPLGASCASGNDCQFRRCDAEICVDPRSCNE